MITSVQNQKIKRVRQLQAHSRARRSQGAFVIEGVRLAAEALAAGWSPEIALYTDNISERGQDILDSFIARGVPVDQVSPHVMRAASDTETPQGLLAVIPRRPLPLPSPLNFAFIPDSVRDPGNLGTMLRTALAAGVNAVLIPPGTVDPFAPKVVRAGMGSHFRLPIHSLEWEEIRARTQGLNIYLAIAGTGEHYTQANLRAPLALIIGGEADGAGFEAQSLATRQVHIPMPGDAESLNAAVAAAVLMFEVVRQRMVRLANGRVHQ